MENIPTVLDWARTLRAAQPDVPIRLDPVTLNPPYPRAGDDPRHGTTFAAAWGARLLKYAALAGIGEVAFAYPLPAPARFAPYAEAPLLETTPTETVDALAMLVNDEPHIWLINLTDEIQQVELEGERYILTAYALTHAKIRS
ncbi:MAG: hypothetical protein BWY76_02770 [bacterium ADurb.Bin429]|nr:MAG: hypothetical protein BWY76_02770 [bacterium ADurb.Bin429]